jgi:hypothetical protein
MPTKPYPGFINGFGKLASLTVDAELTRNLLLEIADAGSPKARGSLRRRPGLRLFSEGLGDGPVRNMFSQDGKTWGVTGEQLFELHDDGTCGQLGIVNPDNRPASISYNGVLFRQLFITSAFAGYRLNTATNDFAHITSAGFPPACLSGAYADLYMLALHNGEPKFSFSELGDADSWSALDIVTKSQTTDNILAMIYDHKELWLLGSKHTEIYANTGDAYNPWAPQPMIIEGGIGAPDSLCQGDSSLFWIHGTGQGAKTIVRADGYNANPIGSQAMHTEIASYARVDDAMGFFIEMEGHGFYLVYFPTANATWAYDVKSKTWAQWSFWNTATGQHDAFLGRCSTNAFGKTLVGSRVDSKIYELTFDVADDNGDAIRCQRRSPHAAASHRMFDFFELELEMARGMGLATGQGADPKVWLTCSNNGGQTWGPEMEANLGVMGDYENRIRFKQLGASRDRVFDVAWSDPVFTGLVDAYIDARPGAH